MVAIGYIHNCSIDPAAKLHFYRRVDKSLIFVPLCLKSNITYLQVLRFYIMRISVFISYIFLILACGSEPELDERILADYIEANSALELSDLVACAGGKENGLLGTASEPTDVIYYPIEGATEIRYFESENVADPLDFTSYIEKELDSEPLFNGYLWKFNNVPFSGERLGIVSYKTPGKIHLANPIRQKTNIKPTEVNSDLLEIIDNGVTPTFTWSDGLIDENIIYFHVVSDLDGNLISGTYTTERQFTFYDLSNVVFNITDPTISPSLEPNTTYRFTLMGVSDDNWVNLFFEKEFVTN